MSGLHSVTFVAKSAQRYVLILRIVTRSILFVASRLYCSLHHVHVTFVASRHVLHSWLLHHIAPVLHLLHCTNVTFVASRPMLHNRTIDPQIHRSHIVYNLYRCSCTCICTVHYFVSRSSDAVVTRTFCQNASRILWTTGIRRPNTSTRLLLEEKTRYQS